MPTTTYRFLNSFFFGGGIVFLCEGTGLMAISDNMIIKQTKLRARTNRRNFLMKDYYQEVIEQLLTVLPTYLATPSHDILMTSWTFNTRTAVFT